MKYGNIKESPREYNTKVLVNADQVYKHIVAGLV